MDKSDQTPLYDLGKARYEFLNGNFTEEEGLKIFEKWRDTESFVLAEKWKFPNHELHKKKVSWRVPKRGDWLYKKNLKKKLAWIDHLPFTKEFEPEDRSKPVQTTKFLFVTWTTHVYHVFRTNKEKHDIWKQDSAICNRTMTRLRQHYGRVEYWRSNEGTQQGFPSPHAVLYFPDHEWNVRKIKGKWRVIGKQFRELKAVLEGKDSRAEAVLGFVDIQGIWSPRESLQHISKYCFMEYNEEQKPRKARIQELTYFWLWITRKHTYSNSRHFKQEIQNYLKILYDLTQSTPVNFKGLFRYLVCFFLVNVEKSSVVRGKPPPCSWEIIEVASPRKAEAWNSRWERVLLPAESSEKDLWLYPVLSFFNYAVIFGLS